MSSDEIERRLRDALAARAEDAVDDVRPVPPPRFLTDPVPARRPVQWLAPVAAAVAVLALIGGVFAIVRTGSSGGSKIAGGHSAASTPDRPLTSSPSSSRASGKSVHIKLFNADGATYGVAMPVIAIFSHKISNARPFVTATTVTVNGNPVKAAWYFEKSVAGLGAMEAHLRPKNYWPAHSRIHVSLATQGQPAGNGLTYDDSLTLDFTTGARTIATVDDRTNYLRVFADGKPLAPPMPVSLGAAKTPTFAGTKVVMSKDTEVALKGPGYNEISPYALRLTYSGEYLIGADWNMAGIAKRRDTSNGCTELRSGDAARLYQLLRVGDPIVYQNAKTPAMPAWDGFGDWNVPWSKWLTGGLLPTS